MEGWETATEQFIMLFNVVVDSMGEKDRLRACAVSSWPGLGKASLKKQLEPICWATCRSQVDCPGRVGSKAVVAD